MQNEKLRGAFEILNHPQAAKPAIQQIWKCALQRLITLGMLLTLGAGCSTFRHDWKAAGAMPAPTDDIQGRWQGMWMSKTNGHHGRLCCVLSKQTTAQYEARFHAKFW